MKISLILLTSILLFNQHVSAQHWTPPHPPRHGQHPHRARHTHSNAYKLNNRVFVKWVPSSLAPVSAASIRFGAEYCFAERFGIALDAGQVLGSSNPNSEYYQFGGHGGFSLNPEFRTYFGFRDEGRGFAGIQGLYRHQQFGSQMGAVGIDGYQYDYNQSGATLNVLGVAAEGGFVVRLAANFHLESAAGIGVKSIDWQRDNLVVNKTYNSYHSMFGAIHESDFIDRGTLPYLFMNVKLSWLIGHPVGGAHRHH